MMSIPGTDDLAARRFWSSPGWLKLSGALMSGLAHDVTGRASALSSLSMVASRGLADSAMVKEELAVEAARLGDIARLLDAFPNASARRGLGVSLADVVSRLPDVLRLATDFRDAEVELDLSELLPAVAVDPGPLSSITLLFMAEALDRSGRPACVLRGSEEDGSVTLAVEVSDPLVEAKPGWLDEEVTAGVAALCASWGGTFQVDHDAPRYTVTLPKL